LERRSKVRIGIPRVLNIWSTAPFWRTYLEALGIDKNNIVFSDFTSEEMWQEGGKYGSIDPCYPSKVAQAHIHNLLFKHHEKKPLDLIFFPCITHIPTHLQNVMDSSSCPIVAGAPNVIKAAFTKEVNFFETRGVVYLDPAVTFTEMHLMKKQLFEAFKDYLHMTEDESDFAVDQGWRAMNIFDSEMQERGKMILEQVEKENRLAILMIGRPYHSDPGLNHSVLEEFQVLGYPILSMRSIPKDEAWLRRFFQGDLESGRVQQALEVSDVWPENFSSNSVQKVWAAKFAARHPNVAVLDLSSFKCGHDAPTYGLIDSIISTAGTPYSALHDIDANKPSGSIKIRVKTYAHSLGLHEERLEDLARKKVELQQRLEQKRMELLGLQSTDTSFDETNLPQTGN
jgi:predicted nucleotide-binding protein (sugar kinase/HSP70/actin superfamily)